MLGRMPLKYRVAIWIAGLVSCAGVGAWVGLMSPLPLLWSSGAVVGALVGAGVGVLIVAGYLSVLEGGPGPRQPADPRR